MLPSEASGTTIVTVVDPIPVTAWPQGRVAPEDHADSRAGALLAEVTCSTTDCAPLGADPPLLAATFGYKERPASTRHVAPSPAPDPARVSRIVYGVTLTKPLMVVGSAMTAGSPWPGLAEELADEQYGWVWAAPVHQLVTPAAPSQDIEMCTWLRWQDVSRLDPAFAADRQPR